MENKKINTEKEYMMLREELMYNQKNRDTLAQFAYTVVGVIITAAFAANNEWIMLCVLIFLLPMSLRVAECSNTTAYIASYMKTHLEPHIDLKWETNHYTYYKENPRKGWEKFIYYFSRLDFPFLSFVSSFLFWLMRGFDFYPQGSLLLGHAIVICQIVVIAIEAIVICRFADIAKKKELHIHRWNMIESDTDK